MKVAACVFAMVALWHFQGASAAGLRVLSSIDSISSANSLSTQSAQPSIAEIESLKEQLDETIAEVEEANDSGDLTEGDTTKLQSILDKYAEATNILDVSILSKLKDAMSSITNNMG